MEKIRVDTSCSVGKVGVVSELERGGNGGQVMGWSIGWRKYGQSGHGGQVHERVAGVGLMGWHEMFGVGGGRVGGAREGGEWQRGVVVAVVNG